MGSLFRCRTCGACEKLVDDWSAVREDIKIRNLRNFYQVDPEFASRVAAGTGVNLEEHVADLK